MIYYQHKHTIKVNLNAVCPPISHVSVLEAQEMQMQSAVFVELVDSLHVLKVWALKISLDLCLMRKAGLMGKSRKKKLSVPYVIYIYYIPGINITIKINNVWIMWLELYWINISFASHDMNNNAYGFLYQVGVKIKKEEKNTPKHMRCSVWRYMYKNENHITNVYKKTCR